MDAQEPIWAPPQISSLAFVTEGDKILMDDGFVEVFSTRSSPDGLVKVIYGRPVDSRPGMMSIGSVSMKSNTSICYMKRLE